MKNLLRSSVYQAEIEQGANKVGGLFSETEDTTIAITGASGVIGREITDILVRLQRTHPLTIVAVGRNRARLENQFSDYCDNSRFLCRNYGELEKIREIDGLIHCASVTASKLFVEQPVETLTENFELTRTLLELMKQRHGRFLYVSSAEAYGEPLCKQESFVENEHGFLDTTAVRNSYPIAKRVCEMLTAAYGAEYGLDYAIARPAKVYALTIPESDRRIFADFTEKVIEKQDIVLKSEGKQRFSYCYGLDVAVGLLYVLRRGTRGKIYNVTDSESIADINELAEIFAKIGGLQIMRRCDPDAGYSRVRHMILDDGAFLNLGYRPQIHLEQGIRRLIDFKREI